MPRGKGLNRKHIVNLYASGLSHEQIAKKFDVSRETIRYHLKRAAMPPRGSYRVPVDEDEVVRLYVEEQISEQEIANRLGTTRVVIKRRLTGRGVVRRGIKEAQAIRMARMAPEERAALASYAHAARRGSKDSELSLAAKAAVRERTLYAVGFGERELLRWLEERGRTGQLQKAIGPYNVDIAIGSVAVEVHINATDPLRIRRHRERIPYILDAGWHVIYIRCTGHRPLLERCADQVVALLEALERDPSARREYRVIWGTGEDASPKSLNLDQIA